MIRKILIIVGLNLILISCGSNTNEKYLGYWELTNEGMYWHPPVIEIVKNGNVYIYRDAFNFEKTGYEVALKDVNNQLVLDSQYIPDLPLSLIDKESVLLIGTRKFIRSDKDRVDIIREELTLKKQTEEQALKDLINSIK